MNPPPNCGSAESAGAASAAQEWLRRGIQSAEQGRALEAGRLFVEALRRQPDCFEAHCRLGMALRDLNQLDNATACLETALRLRPKHPGLNLLLGSVHKQAGRLEAAAECCRREIGLDPANPSAHYNLGLTLHALERGAEAMAAYQQALALRPNYVEALVNQASLFQDQKEFKAAAMACERALRFQPDHAEAHWQLANALLARGEWERGWQEYEWRWKLKDFTTPGGAYPQPRWDGSELAGRRILLHAEQGFGDILQFIRYAPLVAGRGGQVIVGCPRAIASLIARVAGVSQVATSRTSLPPFDVHAPILSLPALFRSTLTTVPAEVPYVSPPPLALPPGLAAEGSLRAGLVWAGDPKHKNNHNRSMPLEAAQPLLALPGVKWFSLQGPPGSSDLAHAPWASAMADLGSRFTDFDATAAAIAQLDVVVSVDTAVGHLAGAQAKPVLLLLPFAAEWRWMADRVDTPWYPTMRLVRQTRPGDWAGVIERVRERLSARDFVT